MNVSIIALEDVPTRLHNVRTMLTGADPLICMNPLGSPLAGSLQRDVLAALHKRPGSPGWPAGRRYSGRPDWVGLWLATNEAQTLVIIDAHRRHLEDLRDVLRSARRARCSVVLCTNGVRQADLLARQLSLTITPIADLPAADASPDEERTRRLGLSYWPEDLASARSMLLQAEPDGPADELLCCTYNATDRWVASHPRASEDRLRRMLEITVADVDEDAAWARAAGAQIALMHQGIDTQITSSRDRPATAMIAPSGQQQDWLRSTDPEVAALEVLSATDLSADLLRLLTVGHLHQRPSGEILLAGFRFTGAAAATLAACCRRPWTADRRPATERLFTNKAIRAAPPARGQPPPQQLHVLVEDLRAAPSWTIGVERCVRIEAHRIINRFVNGSPAMVLRDTAATPYRAAAASALVNAGAALWSGTDGISASRQLRFDQLLDRGDHHGASVIAEFSAARLP